MPNSVYEEKKHFNIIDVMIIICALLITVGIIFRAQIIDVFNSSGKHTTFTVTFEAENVPSNISEQITDGSSVTWTEKSLQLGALSGLNKKAAVVYVPNTVTNPLQMFGGVSYKDGTFNKVTSSDLFKITGSFTAQGNTNNGCYINGTDFLAAGMTVTLATSTAEFTAIITSITEQ